MLFSIKSENLKLASRSRDYMRKGTIENLKTCQPREQNMQLSFDKLCSFPAQNSAFSLCRTRLMSGKLSRLKSKHTRKNRHARFRDALGTPSLSKIVCGNHEFPKMMRSKAIFSLVLYGALSESKFNVQTFPTLNFKTSLFAYNYFLIAALFPV